MLVATISIIVVTGLVALVNGIMIATGGKELFKEALANAGFGEFTDADLESLAQLGGYDSLDSYLSTFTTRGYLSVAGGVALLLFGLCMTKAATWARVLVTITAPLTMIFSFIIVGTDSTSMMAGLGLLTALGCVLAIIFTWLPPNGRYAKALKAAR
jgi:hypothetical protein